MAIPDRTGPEVNDPRPVNLKTFAVFGEVCLATGTLVKDVPDSPTVGSGTGVPTHTRPDGSLFLRTDGATDSTVYKRVSGAWEAIDSGGTATTALALDDGAGNTLTALEGATAYAQAHDQNTDQYLDLGGPNEVTVADVKNAADKAHDRQHDLDSALDHSVGAGTPGQCIGVVPGPALGWLTPSTGGATFKDYGFPVDRNWKTEGAGTAGDWTGSGDLADFDVLAFSGGVFSFSLNNSSGVTKSADFVVDLSAYRNLRTGGPVFDLAAAINLSSLGVGSSCEIYLEHDDGAEQLFVKMENPAAQRLYFASRYNNSVGSFTALSTAANWNGTGEMRVSEATGLAGYWYRVSDNSFVGGGQTTSRLHPRNGTLRGRIHLEVPNGATMTGEMYNFKVGPLYPV